MALIAPSVALPAQRKFAGVTLGVHTYTFRDRSLDETIKALVEVGCGECDLAEAHVEPSRPANTPHYTPALEQWRLTVPLSVFEDAGKKLRASGIEPAGMSYNFPGGPDRVLERGFEMAKALGAKGIGMTIKMSLVPQVDKIARRYKMRVGLHNHSRLIPDEFATPDNYAAALKGCSDYTVINLDLGHFSAAGFDAVKFIRENHGRILNMHVKDRKNNQGPPVPMGQGGTPVVEVLRLVRDQKYPIPGYLEYELLSPNLVSEVKSEFEYCKRAVLS